MDASEWTSQTRYIFRRGKSLKPENCDCTRLLSRMSTGLSTVSPILLALLIIPSPAHGKNVGEGCMIDNSGASLTSGVCKLLQDCPIIYEQLLAGNTPDTGCGFLDFEPIVCCPTNNVVVTKGTTQSTTTTEKITTPRPWKSNGTRGAVARAKCAENAKAVFSFEISFALLLDRHYVNRSTCALKTRKLIVGGTKAEPKEFPHMAAVGYDDDGGIQWSCGGSLISDRIVLTAAHCLYSSDWGDANWVRVGILSLTQTYNANPQTIRVIERIPHPRYEAPSDYHDIGIMKLETKVTYTAWVRPACLPVDLPDVGNDNKAIATGWGRVDWAEDEGSDSLLKVTLDLVSHEFCNESFYDGGNSAQLALGIVDDWQICAGGVGKDTCQGDSGGPLAIFNRVHDCMYDVIGVTSVGKLCGEIIPGVYTRVYHYIPWIEKAAWPEHF